MTTYRLVADRATATTPVLDEHQQAVVDHAGGPLLVLAGPGTGKTTTLVEAIARRIEDGADPASVLALTFSRKAAEQLRDRVIARVGRTVSSTLGATFHSFAYGLIRQWSPPELYDGPLRLLSAPEQDVVLQQILTREAESIVWPESIRGAIGTRGFAGEVAQVLARAQEKGLGSEALRRLGEEEQVPEFVAAAAFMEQYDAVAASQNHLDYPSLIATAVRMLQDPEQPVRDALRAQLRHVFVDEYQDTDPAQVALLRALAGDGRDLTVVGDPHQAIYAFRGAEVRGILEFPDRFRTVAGEPAPTVVLGTTRRFGPRILRAARGVSARLPLPGAVPASALNRFLEPVSEVSEPGEVDLLTFDTDRAEAEHLADLLRRAHLEDGVPWSDMAVLVRSGRATIPGLRRALVAAGVPVDVAADDTPLVREPAVQPLLAALALVVDAEVADPADPSFVGPQRVSELLATPLAGMDATDVRSVARRLRARDRERATAEGRPPRRSPDLLRDAVLDPRVLAAVTDPTPGERKALAIAELLAGARELRAAGATVEELLWHLWAGTTWPQRLRDTTERGGLAARLAHRDLDAVVALFDAAVRAEEQREHTSAGAFLDTLRAQQIPGDTLAETGVRDHAVRLLTAHRAKGLEWPLVVVAHVQEDAWPDLRRRATLLRADRIGVSGLVPPTTARELLADERRLFYVAVTRATRRLVVTAVRSTDDEGEQPSRFLEELFPDEPGRRISHVPGRPRRPLSLPGLVAELRRTVADPDQPEPLRRAAALRLARLTAAHRAGEVRVPWADPASWWGTRAWSVGDEPLRPLDQPVVISASTLTSVDQCPAKWFLEREGGGERPAGQAQGFGNVVHALADRIGRGEVELAGRTSESVVEELMAQVDTVWSQIPFRTPWSAESERSKVREALVGFLSRHRSAEARELVGTEQPLRAEVELADGQRVLLHGYADRIELDTEGRVVVVDLKTGKTAPTKEELRVHPQLGLYQLAVEHGAVPGHDVPGGAELWHLRQQLATSGMRVQQQAPQVPDEDGVRPIERQLSEAVGRLRDEEFPARPGPQCSYCAFERFCPAQTSGTVLS
ncbi:ATP-dependent helicase [Nocardioides coralli]|uniref:ATP-dependent helicase n=1 Tax=Nocardioides coralli TaxID=2872154 RepID=UPI001CA3FB7D|nr:ATP-dependent DNA helicase [Nocardioides coralli]QZY30092.1 ATP-dependent helicase [Nocardioides coralli]